MPFPLLLALTAAQIAAQGQAGAEAQRNATKGSVYNARVGQEEKEWSIKNQQKANDESRRAAISRQFGGKSTLLNDPERGFAPSQLPPHTGGTVSNLETLAGALNAAKGINFGGDDYNYNPTQKEELGSMGFKYNPKRNSYQQGY